MKIMGIIPSQYSDRTAAIVELTNEELRWLVGGNQYHSIGGIVPGASLEICGRFRELVKLEDRIGQSQKVGGSLRAMADAVDAVVDGAKAALVPPETVLP